MNKSNLCRCCLAQPPDKELKTIYTRLGKAEIYGDMLKECFEIHLPIGNTLGDDGICDDCVARLCNAADFKEQVIRCQKKFQNILSRFNVKDEIDETLVKLEYSDLEGVNEAFDLEYKEEFLDDELDVKNNEDLAKVLGFEDVGIKRKAEKRSGKELILEDCSKISYEAISRIEKLKSSKTQQIQYVSDNKKHKVNLDNILKYSNCTPFSNKTLMGIVCAFCKNIYQDINDLRTHYLDAHKDFNDNKRVDKNNLSIKIDINDLKCTICELKIKYITDLKQHLTSAHDIKFYPNINDYILEFKLSTTQIYNCALCDSNYETFKTLLQHMNGHYRNYICDVCDMGFINQHRLKNHMRTHEVGAFKCTHCDKIFSTRVRKNCHEKYTHNSTARYITNCPRCDRTFTSYYQRNRHMFNDHNTVAASYKCNVCDKSFILKSKLTSHIKKVHLMERNHICSVCGQGFFVKQLLDEHMVKHNGERVFKCTVCHKSYARKKTLREHMRIHNNDRRFKCGLCSLAFVQKCSLKSHMLSNHGLTLMEFENNR